jgi:acyl transferase domain-containing protein/acyl carrier protein
LQVHGTTKDAVYAVVRTQTAQADTLDIDLVDEQGWVCVRLLGLRLEASSQRVESIPADLQAPAAPLEPRDFDSGIVHMLSTILQIEAPLIREASSFQELGLDSITGMELLTAMNDRWGLKLDPATLFQCQTLSALTEHLSQLQPPPDVPSVSQAPAASSRSTGATDRRSGGEGKKRRSASSQNVPEGIAIVGIGGRYPQADSVDQYWENILAGRDSVTEVPAHRWALEGFYQPNKSEAIKQGLSYNKLGGFLNDFDAFDLDYLGVSEAEASVVNPKELLFLETVALMFEAAGYASEEIHSRYKGNVGVFVGVVGGTQNYGGERATRQRLTSFELSSAIPHRVSHHFDLTGPSMAIDTQSSSSMTAVHMACESIRNGDCSMAIAGGVTLLYPELFSFLSQFGMLGSRANSRSFHEGDGLLLSEGVGAVLLKPLADAMADGDNVLAVIKATAACHAGKSRMGLLPNQHAQTQLFTAALKKADIHPGTISLVEAAANGSIAGDCIEIAALTTAFEAGASSDQRCALGSVKSNIGHAEAASGMSQLTKAVLQLLHRKIVPPLQLGVSNPHLRLSSSPFYIPSELSDWDTPTVLENGREQAVPRRAMVNSFGATGAYATAILEEHQAPVCTVADKLLQQGLPQAELILLSAHGPEQLRLQAKQLSQFLDASAASHLSDVAFTLQVGRNHLSCRLALRVGSMQELRVSLQRYLCGEDDVPGSIYSGRTESTPARAGQEKGASTERAEMAGLVADRQLETLATQWVMGATVPWRLLPQGRARRLTLPTYPLLRKRLPSSETSDSYRPSGPDTADEVAGADDSESASVWSAPQ